MKLVCSQSELNSALQLVSRAVASRPTHPVLANVLITADAGTGRLSLTGFDLNLGIQTSFSASVETSGAITLPSKLFGEIISRLDNDSPITFSVKENSELVELKSLSGNYQMKGMTADDFPELPLVESGNSIKIKTEILIKSLRSTLFASSSDEAKQLLTGVHLKFNNQSMETAATDGHRLAVLNIPQAFDITSNENPIELSITLPSRSLRELERLISTWKEHEDISFFCDKGQVVFLTSNQVITSRTLEGKYPNYNQLIPDEFSRCLEIDRKMFIAALERVAVLADQYNNVIKLSVEDSSDLVVISADVQDVGSGSESLSATLTGSGFQIAFNVRYVLDGLKSIEAPKINLRCNAPTTPAIFSPVDVKSSFTYLVMPVQIRT